MISRADLGTLWLLGHPVSHSLSPLIQNSALRALGADLVYLAADVRPEDFQAVVDALPRLGAIGANVTVPHKQQAFRLCRQLSPRARAMRAVNTLHFRSDGLYGDNTDGVGWWSALRQSKPEFHFPRALVIGAGGAARSIVHTLAQQGMREFVLLNRSRSNAQALQAEVLQDYPGIDFCLEPLESFRGCLRADTLVVQTTSVGLRGVGSPVELPDRWPKGAFLSELIYGQKTPLLQAVEALGGEGQDGLGMLCGQAAFSLALWLEREPGVIPLDLMVQTARTHFAGKA